MSGVPTPRNWKSDDARLLARRNRVAYYLIRGLKPTEIASLLKQEGFPKANPATIRRDIAWLKKEWAHQLRQSQEVLLGREVATINEVEAQAWATDNHPLVLDCVKIRARLLGLEPPQRLEFRPAVQIYLPQISELPNESKDTGEMP